MGVSASGMKEDLRNFSGAMKQLYVKVQNLHKGRKQSAGRGLFGKNSTVLLPRTASCSPKAFSSAKVISERDLPCAKTIDHRESSLMITGKKTLTDLIKLDEQNHNTQMTTTDGETTK